MRRVSRSSPLNVPPRDFLDRWIHIFVSSFSLLLGSSPSGTPLRPRERETVAQCSRSSRLREKTVANALEDENTEADMLCSDETRVMLGFGFVFTPGAQNK